MSAEVAPAKGCFDGECNRTACNASGARYFNRFTHGYYCGGCARKIDIDDVTDPTTPNAFDYPQRPDTADRHLNRSQQRFKNDHPDRQS